MLTHAILALLAAGVSIAALFALFTRYTARRVEAALPPAGRFVDVPGARLHVREQGSGPTLLLVHGLGAQMGNYTYGVTAKLAKHFRVITVDRPGSGYSKRHANVSADISTQASALAALIEMMRAGPALIVGHSLGGAVALTLAVEHPRHVAGLALVAPLSHMPSGVPSAFKALTIRSTWLRTLVAWTLAVPASIVRGPAILGWVFGPEPVPRDYATRGGGLLGLRPSHFLGASADIQALPARLPEISSRYEDINVPVRVLYGRDDRVLDWNLHGQALVARIAGAEMELVEGGHMLPITQADTTARFIQEAAHQIWGPVGQTDFTRPAAA